MRDFGIDGPRILILEGNVGFARLLRSQLMHLGMSRIRLASDTEEALLLIGSHPFHAVLADAEAGPHKVASFVRKVRDDNLSLDPFVPVLTSSFYATMPKIEACRDAGANGFFAKPASVSEITDRLHALLTEPRKFIRASSYFGPDRRKGRRPPFYGMDRRTRGRLTKVAIPMAREVALPAVSDELVIEPDRALI